MMAMQRMIEFGTSSDEGAEQVRQALEATFRRPGAGVPHRSRSGVLAHSRHSSLRDPDRPGRRGAEPAAARALPQIIGACVPGGYPRPEVVEQVGSSNLPRPVDDAEPRPHAR